jgi:VWFA-related protein
MAFDPRLPVRLLCASALLCLGGVAAQQPGKPPTQTDSYKIQVKVNSVLVPVVVRDSQGHAVANLTREDFQLFDKNKKQTITGFTVEKRAALDNQVTPSEPQSPGSATPEIPKALEPQRRSAPHFIVFLFDDLHMTAPDLAPLKKAATKILDETLREGDPASVISILGHNDSGVTNDRARLAETIAKIQVIRSPYQLDPHACPHVDLYHADYIETKHDERVFEAAVDETLDCAHLDPLTMRPRAEQMTHEAAQRVMALGEQEVRFTLTYIRNLVSKMGNLPGQRTLVLLSPGFYTDMPEAMILESQVMDAAARANVTINTLDVRGLYTAAPKAEDELNGTQKDTTQRIRSNVESLTGIEAVMSGLADASGGTFIHSSNDIEGGLRRLAAAPEYIYLLEFSLDKVKPDGGYHPIKVKVNRSGVQVQSRHGYFAPKTAKQKALLAAAEPPPPTQTPAETQTPSAPPSPAKLPSSATEPSPASTQPPVAPVSSSAANQSTVASQNPNASPSSASTQDSPTESPSLAPPPSAPTPSGETSSSATEQLSPLATSPSPAPSKLGEKKKKSNGLFWDPPDPDASLHSHGDPRACILSTVLAEAETRATELVTNLQNFTAQEQIEYRTLGGMGMADQIDGGSGAFEYTAALEHHTGGFVVRESRTPEHSSGRFPIETQDIGLPEMALVFLPDLQPNYEMKCDGAMDWNGRAAWVVRFRQRKDRPNQTASFSTRAGVFPAPLKGRAWIAQGSGEVIHLEIALMREIPQANVRQWFLSIDYAPVRFLTRDVVVWLPQSANTFGDFSTRRTVVSHRFSNFLLFSVQTTEEITKPTP